MKYKLIDAREKPDVYIALFRLYCTELLKEDPSIAQYNPDELANENLQSVQDHPYLIAVNERIAGLVVFMDEKKPVGEHDCHTYLGELFILEEYRKHGLASQIASDYFASLKYDTGLCYIRGSYGERFWKNLMDSKSYKYKVFKEDEIRDFIHIYIFAEEKA